MGSDLYSPDLRIFLSVDLIGSTAFKQLSTATDKASEKYHSWLFSFFDFYTEFKTVYLGVLEQHKLHYGVDIYEQPHLWKRLGDELLFSASLQNTKQPLFFIECFRVAMVEYEKKIHELNWPLGLKGTAWIAGFPVRNVKIPAETDGELAEDYIGPCIDLGFRLSKYSTARKFVLSVELVWLVLSFLEDQKSFPIYYDGKEDIKGFRGGNYPVFWTSKPGKRENDKEMLLLDLRPCSDSDHVVSFCQGFIANSSNDLQLPFIYADENLKQFVPDNFIEQCDIVRRMQGLNFTSINETIEAEDKALSEDLQLTEEILDSIPEPLRKSE